jgi:hypothetical protein
MATARPRVTDTGCRKHQQEAGDYQRQGLRLLPFVHRGHCHVGFLEEQRLGLLERRLMQPLQRLLGPRFRDDARSSPVKSCSPVEA